MANVMDEFKLKQIKSTLRSILISSTKKNTIKSILNDYNHMTGHEMPYRQYGFKTPLKFLQTMPDIVKIQFRNNQYILYGVSSPQTQHIQNLIDSQKNSIKTVNDIFVPFKLESYIVEAFYYYTKGLSFQELKELIVSNTDFSEKQLDFLGGLDNIIKNIIYIFYDSSENKIKLKHSFLNKPRNVCFNNYTEKDFSFFKILPSSHDKSNQSSIYQNEIPSISTEESITSSELMRPISSPSLSKITQTLSSNNEINKYNQDENIINNTKLALNDLIISTDAISDRMKENFFKLLDEHPEGILCSELNNLYKEKFNCTVEFASLGYESMVQLAADISDVFNLKNHDKTDWLLMDARQLIPQVNSDRLKEIFNDKIIEDRRLPKAMKYKIIKLLLKYKNGITMNNFSTKFKDLNGIDLNNPQLWNFSSSLQLFESLSDCIIITRKRDDDYLLFPKQTLCNAVVSVPEIPSDDPIFEYQFPPGVATPSTTIDSQRLPADVTIGDCVEVIINEIINPSCFWISLRTPECIVELEKLMDNMQEYFCDRQSSLLMPPICVRPNQIAAALYLNEWHRVEILHIDNTEMMARLFYFDYGTIYSIPISDIYFLPIRFTKLKRQAILCRLTQIDIPIGYESWPPKSSEVFKEIIYNKPLVAIVTHIDSSDQSFNTLLVDTSGTKDIIVNNLLVERGVASTTLGTNFQQYLQDNKIIKSTKKKSKNHIKNMEDIHSNDTSSPIHNLSKTPENPHYNFEGPFQTKKLLSRTNSPLSKQNHSIEQTNIGIKQHQVMYYSKKNIYLETVNDLFELLVLEQTNILKEVQKYYNDWKIIPNLQTSQASSSSSNNNISNIISTPTTPTTISSTTIHFQENTSSTVTLVNPINSNVLSISHQLQEYPTSTSIVSPNNSDIFSTLYQQQQPQQSETSNLMSLATKKSILDIQAITKTPLTTAISTIRLRKILFHRAIIFEKNYLFTLELLYSFTSLRSMKEFMRLQMCSPINIQFLEFNRNDEPVLFKELEKYPIIYGNESGSVNLIPLEYIHQFLLMFGVSDAEILQTIKEYSKK